MSNVAGKASALTVITPQQSGLLKLWLFRLIRLAPNLFRPLKGLQMIHFAQWYVIPRSFWAKQQPQSDVTQDQLLFLSHFNGSWDQYIDAFSDGAPLGVNLTWLWSQGFPGAVPLTPFKHYIRHNTVDCDYFYSATPGVAQRDIKSALRLARIIADLSQCHAQLPASEFAQKFHRCMKDAHRLLAASGSSPPPSNETETARLSRWRHVRMLHKRMSDQLPSETFSKVGG